MKRYDHEDTGAPGYPEHMMIEYKDGEWVRYEDVEDVDKRIDDAFSDGYWLGYNNRSVEHSRVDLCASSAVAGGGYVTIDDINTLILKLIKRIDALEKK